jgi:potassium-dependent mechanosensitive channel
LHRLVLLYEQQLSNTAALEKARTRKAEIAREAQAWTRFAEPPPYSILLSDRLREEIQTERQKIKNGEAAASMLSQLVEENRGALTQAEEKLRQLQEQLESATGPAVTARLSWQRELERLRSQVAASTVAVLDSEQLVGQESLAASRVRLELLQRQLILADAGAKFTQADLEKLSSQIEAQRGQLERELGEIQNRRVSAIGALEVAREALRVTPGRPEGSPATSRAMELVSVRESQLDAIETATSVLRLMLEGANIERTMWEMRFAAFDSRSAETLLESERRLGAFSRRLDLWRNYWQQQLERSSSELRLHETRLNTLPPDSDLLPLARERSSALLARDQMLLRVVRDIERLEHLTQRWAEGLQAAESRLPLTGRVRNLFSDARSFVQRLWTFEVFTAEDTVTVDGQKITGKRSVTVGKIALALLILVVGYWITGLITAFLEPMTVKRLKIEPNQANLIRRWLRAFMVMCLVVFSLVSVKIPLTVFAFAGGALAIALGFGMQTVLKNFVSGLILLFERPFRVGDILDVGGQKGTVTSIGLRASILSLWDGTETLIPNSSLLESNVTNWTYSNRKVRFVVTVGVAYSSDPRKVMQLLGEVAERHGLVEKDPKPQVLFTDFGDSTLSFELRFWVDIARTNAAQISSDLRLMIAGSFAEYGIVIDYPQRDIHLQAARPLQVQVVPSGEADSARLAPKSPGPEEPRARP